MPQPTLYAWIQKGRLSCRNVGGGSKRAKLVFADPDTVAALKTIRATPPPWRRIPPAAQRCQTSPTTESRESPCLVDIEGPAFGVELDDLRSGARAVASGQVPSLLHAGGMNANNRAHLLTGGGDFGVAQLARPPAFVDLLTFQ